MQATAGRSGLSRIHRPLLSVTGAGTHLLPEAQRAVCYTEGSWSARVSDRMLTHPVVPGRHHSTTPYPTVLG